MNTTISTYLNNNVISLVNGDRQIIIDTFSKTIECNAPGGVWPMMKLSYNKDNVLKYNKASISTCNIEMLVYTLVNDAVTFNNVYGYVKYRVYGYNDTKTINAAAGIKKAAFYNSFNDNIPAFIEFFTSCSSSTRQAIIADHICYDHDAKMAGIISLSTYVGNNTFCQARCKNCDNAICKYCYAASLTGQRYYLKMKLIRIMAVLTTVELSAADIPVIDYRLYPYFRFESFGDLENKLQFVNYNLIAAYNPMVNFTIWTKNPGIIQAAIDDGLQLANNIVVGLSSLYLN